MNSFQPLHALLVNSVESDNESSHNQNDGSLPLFRCLYDLNPDAITIAEFPSGDLPLHVAVQYSLPMDVIKFLFEKYPQAAEIQNSEGKLLMTLSSPHTLAVLVLMFTQKFFSAYTFKES